MNEERTKIAQELLKNGYELDYTLELRIQEAKSIYGQTEEKS